ncbi:MAG: ribosome maturation factor RimP [Acidobacteria bacterium]|jgi:ribosome maturation factor RimP|nr:ribosome maturation factor RimP [Acidobacteriota bacterium]
MKQPLVDQIYEIADRIARAAGLEIVEVELLGGGAARLLRVYIDRVSVNKDGGVSHADCELLSRELGAELDAGDIIPGAAGYHLEVSSPGVERKLVRPRDYSRFTGQKVKISLREPVDGTKRYEGVLTSFVDGIVTLETPAKPVAIPFDLISKANLKFEW